MIIEIDNIKVQIDEEDAPRILACNWNIVQDSFRKYGYTYFKKHINVGDRRTTITLHRYIMGCVTGDGIIVDYINGNTSDNRKDNLRRCTLAENGRNRRLDKDSTTGYKGVQRTKQEGVYAVQIRYNNKLIHLGYYTDIIFAAKIYDQVAMLLFKEFSRVNFANIPLDTDYANELYTTALSGIYRNRRDNKSGYKGVSYHKTKNMWRASITIEGKQRHIGTYVTPEEANDAIQKYKQLKEEK